MLIKRSSSRLSKRSGVTILEVLVVLSIIALISAVVGPRLVGYLGRAKSETAELQIKHLGDALKLFYIDTGRYPAAAEGLAVLMQAPAGEVSWNGPYLDNAGALADPWGRDYLYEPPKTGTAFKVSSLGRDGTPGGSGEDRDLSH